MRDFHRIVRGALPPTESFEQPPSFLAAAAPQFRYGDRPGNPVDDLVGMTPQQALVGPRKPVLGQVADHLKKGRADVVVEIFRGKFFLSCPGKAGANVGRKFV